MLVFLLAYGLGAQRTAVKLRAERDQIGKAPPAIAPETLAALQARVKPMLAVTGHEVVGNIVQLSGHLRGEPDEMFRKIREAFASDPITPMLLEGDQGDVNLVCSFRQKRRSKSRGESTGLYIGCYSWPQSRPLPGLGLSMWVLTCSSIRNSSL